MSMETYDWLSTNVLAGFTNDARRVPWWATGDEANLFGGAVPMEDVERLLTSWDVEKVPVFTRSTVNGGADDGAETYTPVEGFMQIQTTDSGDTLAIVSADYKVHSYRDWLTETIKECVGDDAQVSTAGMLRNRAQAWVQIERPEPSTANAGVSFLPYVCLSTSYDQSLASQINQGSVNTVCDNTLNLTRGSGLVSRIKHTSGSGSRLANHRGVMVALTEGETEFAQEVNRLLDMKVSDADFSKFISALVPESDDDTPVKATRVARKRQEITQLYKGDERAASWKGSAWGVLQAVNTWEQHMSQLRNDTGVENVSDTQLRAKRNYTQLATGKGGSDDRGTVKVLEGVL